MNNFTKLQQGSPSRDAFKKKHKQLSKSFYAMDIDFCLIVRDPVPDIIAILDYKKHGDEITFTEVIGYNAIIRRGIPVYIVTGDADAGEFVIEKYVGGHHVKPTSKKEFVVRTANWREFEQWEIRLRHHAQSVFEESVDFSN